jgi:bacterioferritin-associated ferredoxin
MVICICKVVSDYDIRISCLEGSKSLKDLQTNLGVCIQCQKCKIQINELLDECYGKGSHQ